MRKTYFSMVGLVVLALVLAFPLLVLAASNDVQFTSAQSIYLSGTEITLTVSSGGNVESLVVGTNSFNVTLAAESAITVTSSTHRKLTTSDATGVTTSYTCGDSASSVALSVAAGDPTKTITVTPSTDPCFVNVGGGTPGGGGGGGGTSIVIPSSTSVAINNGAQVTNSVNVTLTLAATNATSMIIANDAYFTGRDWENYATSTVWTLTSGEGNKAVYAKFRSNTAGVSTAVSDNITLTSASATGAEQGAAYSPVAGDKIRTFSDPGVYYVGSDLKAHFYGTLNTVESWHGVSTAANYWKNFGAKFLYDSEFLSVTQGAAIVLKPGSLVKFTHVPSVIYFVSTTGKIAKLADDATAKSLFGSNYATKAKPIQPAFAANYSNSLTDISASNAVYPDGALISKDGSRYLIDGGKARKFTTDDAVIANGYKTTDAYTAPAAYTLPAAGSDITGVEDSIKNPVATGTVVAASAGTLTVTLASDVVIAAAGVDYPEG